MTAMTLLPMSGRPAGRAAGDPRPVAQSAVVAEAFRLVPPLACPGRGSPACNPATCPAARICAALAA